MLNTPSLRAPYKVSTADGQVRLLVMDATKDGLPSAFALLGTTAKHKVAIRLAGGCKGMNAADKAHMLDYFAVAFDGYRGVIWSGGTRAVKDGVVDPMVTDVPGVIADNNAGCVALGTVPRTALMTLQEDSRLVLDQYGNAPNPGMTGILVVQNGPDGELGWDGDLKTYATLMNQWRDSGGFKRLGLISWNGGDVTKDEILMSIRNGWTTILVDGTGRATDELVGEIMRDLDAFGTKYNLPSGWDARTSLVPKTNPAILAKLLHEKGFILL